jgi:hypothetical protein
MVDFVPHALGLLRELLHGEARIAVHVSGLIPNCPLLKSLLSLRANGLCDDDSRESEYRGRNHHAIGESGPARRARVSAEQNKALVRRFFEEAWVKGNVPAVDEFMAADYVEHPRPSTLPPKA